MTETFIGEGNRSYPMPLDNAKNKVVKQPEKEQRKGFIYHRECLPN